MWPNFWILGQLIKLVAVLSMPPWHLIICAVSDDNEGSDEVIAHAPMLDLGGLIKPGTVVRMTKSKPGGKTSHAVQLVQVLEAECSVARCYINARFTIPFLGCAAL